MRIRIIRRLSPWMLMGLAMTVWGGCAIQRDRVWVRESERRDALASSDAALKREIEDISVWERDRRVQESGWFEEARR